MRPTWTVPCGWLRAPPGPWGWRWWTDGGPGKEVPRGPVQGGSGPTVSDSRRRRPGEGLLLRQVRRDRRCGGLTWGGPPPPPPGGPGERGAGPWDPEGGSGGCEKPGG